MKTSFTTVSLFFAAAFPGSLVATALGLPLPAALDPGTTFGIFVAAFTVLTVLGDYARPPVRSRAFASGADSANPATAHGTEERRLAA